jgi:hypothetical protein
MMSKKILLDGVLENDNRTILAKSFIYNLSFRIPEICGSKSHLLVKHQEFSDTLALVGFSMLPPGTKITILAELPEGEE